MNLTEVVALARSISVSVVCLLVTLAACGGGDPKASSLTQVIGATVQHQSSQPAGLGPGGPIARRWVAQLQSMTFSASASPSQQKSLGSAVFSSLSGRACPNGYRDNCSAFGDPNAKFSWVVVGDSHAFMWDPAFQQIAQNHPELVIFRFSASICNNSASPDGILPPGVSNVTAQSFRDCNRMHARVQKFFRTYHPKVVVFSDSARNALDSNRSAAYLAGYKRFMEAASASGATVKILGQTPHWTNPSDCLNSDFTNVTSCSANAGDVGDVITALQALAQEVSADYIDVTSWFCTVGECPLFIGDVAVSPDGSHVNRALAVKLSAVVYEAIQAA